ncbi:MAG: thiamine-phosphate pyrophosphorylase [Candidatus Krumholzibacteriota bacterium]|nr:thiamine-phosphate pyrophosphorylase [Candidatus Krumholzibacteriota bacterium]
MTKRIGHLHVLTDETVQNRFTHLELAERAIDGGADTIQFRDKNKSTRELLAVAASLVRLCRSRGVPLIINDRVDVAIAIGADGVHLGQQDIPVSVARKLVGPDRIVGGTAATLADALAAQREGADYVGFGHIYPTGSKRKPGPPKGPDAVREVSAALSIPVVAIGGIDRGNYLGVFEAGAWGIAVIAAVCASPDPALAAREISSGIDSFFKRSGS